MIEVHCHHGWYALIICRRLFYLSLASTNPPVLHLEMWDKDPVGKDSMGEGVLPLDGDLKRDLMAAGEHRSVTKIVPLHRKGKLAGSVELEVIGEFRGRCDFMECSLFSPPQRLLIGV